MEQKDVQMLEWPRNSPDLNSIENSYSLMKKNVLEKYPSSLDALQAAITEFWEREISPNYCGKLIDNMPRCLQEVIRNKSGPTKY